MTALRQKLPFAPDGPLHFANRFELTPFSRDEHSCPAAKDPPIDHFACSCDLVHTSVFQALLTGVPVVN
jgi:hypothetical protein